MTDYILSLDKIRNKFIDKDGEELSVPQSFGLASPTVEKQTKEADVKVDSPATEALGTAYQYDTGDYNTTEKYDYQIQPGDTLTKIAREAKMTIPELIKMNKGNPAIKTSDLIYAGGTINLSNKVKTKSDIINYDTKPASVLTEESNVSKIMYEMSEKYDLPFNLVMAVGQKESGLNPYTVAGDAGTALGLMQVRGLALKDVNKHYGLDITRDEQNPKSKNYDIRKSIESGVAYLALQKDKYGADTDREVLAQYNGGPTGNKKKAALEYADSVLGLMKNVKPFDFDAKFTTGSRTPPGEVDSYAIEADNNFREVENASVAGVDYDLLSHANNTIKGVKNNIMPNLDLVGTVKATATDMLVDSISLSDKLSNQLKGFAKQIGNATDIEALKEKAEEVKNFLAKHQKDLANFTGTVKDKTMEALGSGGSAESGGIGIKGEGQKKVSKKLSEGLSADKIYAAGLPIST
jgi:LysM repeat protein